MACESEGETKWESAYWGDIEVQQSPACSRDRSAPTDCGGVSAAARVVDEGVQGRGGTADDDWSVGVQAGCVIVRGAWECSGVEQRVQRQITRGRGLWLVVYR
jgi:hypothetical protein